MKRLFLTIALLSAALGAWAYDFSAQTPAGQTLYYSYTTDGVEVTCPGATNASGAWSAYTKPSGALVIPDTVANGGTAYAVVGVGRYAFYGCNNITSVVVPEGVATIGQAAFSGCSSMATATLPSTLTALSNTSFYGCSSLMQLVCNATVPPTATVTTFGGVPVDSCLLVVPCSGEAAYGATTPWSAFQNIVAPTCNATVTATVNHAERGTVSGSGTYAYATSVVLTAIPADGFFFACWNDGDTVNPRIVTLTADTSFMALLFAMQRDTMVLTDTVHDTLTLHDTVRVVVVHEDTVTIYDTITIENTDTVYVHDSVTPTFFRVQVVGGDGGVGVGNTVVPAGTSLEIAALPLEGYRFVGWDDGTADNPRVVTVMGNVTYTAEFSSIGGLGIVPDPSWQAVASGHDIVVTGAAGRTVRVYDIAGRCLFADMAVADRLVLRMPSAGLFLVSVDGSAARKIVIEQH